jgi:RNA polymerase sigma-70 factor (ECF subfamily)
MRDLTVSELERLAAEANVADVAFQMDEETFRAFYDRTARALWGYLSRLTGDRQLAEDLLQETYYRFLRANVTFESDDHRRNYLFRIATNLVRDRHRRARLGGITTGFDADQDGPPSPAVDVAEDCARRTDVHRAMARLKPRERALLWLAYAHGHPHTEIAEVLGVKTASVKLLLFRARRKLAELLRDARSRAERGTNRGAR